MTTETLTDIQALNATICWRQDTGEGQAVIRVESDVGDVPTFVPGQFCTLALPQLDMDGKPMVVNGRPKRVRRAYSIASSADERRYLELYIVEIKDGKLTPRLFDMSVGGRVYLDPRISGRFTLEEIPTNKDLVMVATGTGVAPYLSMLRTYLGRNEKPWRKCVLIHGARYTEDLGYQDELQSFAANDPSVVYLPIVSREPETSGWKGQRGHVQDILERDTFQRLTATPLSPETSQVFLCGNPNMIMSVEALLHERGFATHSRDEPGHIHYERYW